MQDLKIRNKEVRKVRVADLVDSPCNPRIHPDLQRDALGGAIDEIGWYGYPDVYTNDDGKLQICDGHLRKSWLIEHYGQDCVIQVNVTDFNEAEAKVAIATHDPLAAMAKTNEEVLNQLVSDLHVRNEKLKEMIDDMRLKEISPPDEFPEVDEDINVDHECPKCGYKWS